MRTAVLCLLLRYAATGSALAQESGNLKFDVALEFAGTWGRVEDCFPLRPTAQTAISERR